MRTSPEAVSHVSRIREAKIQKDSPKSLLWSFRCKHRSLLVINEGSRFIVFIIFDQKNALKHTNRVSWRSTRRDAWPVSIDCWTP